MSFVVGARKVGVGEVAEQFDDLEIVPPRRFFFGSMSAKARTYIFVIDYSRPSTCPVFEDAISALEAA